MRTGGEAPHDAPRRVLILGAAGRDFHNFNVVFRHDPSHRVVAFTATQIPGIGGRRYPAELAGPLYPEGIPIEEEAELEGICRRESVDVVYFSYSDVPHAAVMHLASRALAVGADFALLGPHRTMLPCTRPVVAVGAVRTGCGKSQIARYVAGFLRDRGFRVAVLRHPMPYGDLRRQRVQRFVVQADLEAADCTAEEREEYEPHLEAGHLVFAGVDYAAIVAAAEAEADVIVWDGGNNDFPFLRPDLLLTVVDALRPGQTTSHHPGEAVLRMADVVVLNKVDAAGSEAVASLRQEIEAVVPGRPVVEAASPVRIEDEAAVRGRRVLVVEDGPTLTHGGMPWGAGYVAVQRLGVILVDPRPFAPAALRDALAAFPHLGPVLPALGYGEAQREDLRRTIDASDADVVVAATPLDLAALLRPAKPVVRARYGYASVGTPCLEDHLEAFVTRFLSR